MFEKDIGKLEKALGFTFENRVLLIEAITHKSFSSSDDNNQRLEFLGDSILNTIISEYLFDEFGNHNEGKMTSMRASLVNENSLYELAKKIKLNEFMLMSDDEIMRKGNLRKAALSDTYEAIIGAIYIDTGLNNCKNFIINNIIDKELIYSKPQKHPKSILQEFCLLQYNTLPKYSILNKSGNEHQPVYEVSVCVKNHDVVSATGANLKKAEEAAAIKLLNILKI